MLDVTFDEFESRLVDEVYRRSGVDFFSVIGDAPTMDFYDAGYSISESVRLIMDLMSDRGVEV